MERIVPGLYNCTEKYHSCEAGYQYQMGIKRIYNLPQSELACIVYIYLPATYVPIALYPYNLLYPLPCLPCKYRRDAVVWEMFMNVFNT